MQYLTPSGLTDQPPSSDPKPPHDSQSSNPERHAGGTPLSDVSATAVDVSQIADWLRQLVAPDQVIELLAVGVPIPGLNQPGRRAGFFDYGHLDDMARHAVELSGNAQGIYFSINPLNPSILSRCSNRIDAPHRGALASDEDVLRRR